MVSLPWREDGSVFFIRPLTGVSLTRPPTGVFITWPSGVFFTRPPTGVFITWPSGVSFARPSAGASSLDSPWSLLYSTPYWSLLHWTLSGVSFTRPSTGVSFTRPSTGVFFVRPSTAVFWPESESRLCLVSLSLSDSNLLKLCHSFPKYVCKFATAYSGSCNTFCFKLQFNWWWLNKTRLI